ncbi:MAG: acyl--CoA ligase [Verrucomicrobia bacterium]|nr:acyl--CoA ligase [Verrucomicrobiota bacterium]
MSRALLAAWEKTLRRHADRPAVVQAGDGRTATFSQLAAGAAAWRAAHIRGDELRGRAVVLALPNGLAWLEIFLALLQAGAVVVPLDAAEPAEAQRRMAEAVRAAAWWDGARLVPLPGARCYRDPAVCLIKLTSGSTGGPRALVFTAAQLLADTCHIMATMGLTSRDRNYALIPFGHAYGLGNLVVPLLAHGVPLVCGSAPLPHAMAEDFARWQPTVFPGVPPLWRAVVAADAKLSGLRLGISAGAPLPVETARGFAEKFGGRLHGFYGSSETGGIAYDATGDATLAGGVGRALRGVKLKMLRGQRVQVSSAAVHTHGNRRRSGRHGAWVMPDRVARDAQGRLTVLGRRGLTVKIAGRRVNLAEITERLRQLRGVTDVWVGVREGPEPVLGAALATARTPVDVRAELAAGTAAWRIPKHLVTLPAFPTTARGKTDTAALRARVFLSRG